MQGGWGPREKKEEGGWGKGGDIHAGGYLESFSGSFIREQGRLIRGRWADSPPRLWLHRLYLSPPSPCPRLHPTLCLPPSACWSPQPRSWHTRPPSTRRTRRRSACLVRGAAKPRAKFRRARPPVCEPAPGPAAPTWGAHVVIVTQGGDWGEGGGERAGDGPACRRARHARAPASPTPLITLCPRFPLLFLRRPLPRRLVARDEIQGSRLEKGVCVWGG